MTQVWQTGDSRLATAKGAPEAIAALCKMGPVAQKAVTAQVNQMAARGLRVLGLAVAEAATLPEGQDGFAFRYLGLAGLADPLRAQVPAAVAECQAAGIKVVMITGDYPATASSIAQQAGLERPDQVLTGADLERLDDAALAERIRTVNVFARVVPAQKLRLVQAFKADGEVVAMTGDGVNDAPALKAAHIGVAMGGRGTDVAREAAALVLLDDDFSSIVAAIKLGRRIYDNIRKAMAFTVAVHIPIAGLSILPVFFPGWPLLLLPMHIVFLELVIDPSCSLIFEAEEAEGDLMRRPPRDPKERLFTWKTLGSAVLEGLSSLALCLVVYFASRASHGVDAARALTFTTLVVSFLAIIMTSRSRTFVSFRQACVNP
jgi:Ca2+-transporting ATPase